MAKSRCSGCFGRWRERRLWRRRSVWQAAGKRTGRLRGGLALLLAAELGFFGRTCFINHTGHQFRLIRVEESYRLEWSDADSETPVFGIRIAPSDWELEVYFAQPEPVGSDSKPASSDLKPARPDSEPDAAGKKPGGQTSDAKPPKGRQEMP